jgi:hypothetical protein
MRRNLYQAESKYDAKGFEKIQEPHFRSRENQVKQQKVLSFDVKFESVFIY